MFKRLLWGSLLRRRARMAPVFLAIVVGTGIASTLINFYYDSHLKMTHELRHYGANLMVAPAGIATTSHESSSASGHAAPPTMDTPTRHALERLLTQYRVLAQVPFYFITAKSGSTVLTVTGAEVEGLKKIQSWWKVEGKWLDAEESPPRCLIGRQVARRLGLTLGQELALQGVSSQDKREHRWRIAGIVDTGAAEDERVFVSLPAAWALSGQTGAIHTLAVNVLGTGAEVERMAQVIEQAFPELQAKPVRRISQAEGAILEKIKWMLVITISVILMITTICAMTTLAAMIIERRKEVALMRALGAGKAQVLKLLVGEVLMLGLAGGLAGYLAGLGGAHLLERQLFQSGITVRPILLPIILVMACVLMALAGCIAVRRALGVQPAVSLKGE